MDFQLLGPVRIRRADGEAVRLHRRQERLALAVLLLEPGHTVAADRLIDLLWEQGPPPAARATLQTLMSRIRGALRSATGGVAGEQSLLSAQGHGYLLRIDAEAVDLHRFRSLVHRARAVDDPAVRSSRLAAALELWHGPALSDAADGTVREQLCGDLEELRFAATSDRIDADLAAGRHAELIPELFKQVAAQPLREHGYVQLMLALYRTGRRAEALDAYRRARQLLVTELALEPGPQLHALEAAIIADAPELRVPAAEQPLLPAQLPPELGSFVGRLGCLNRLDAVLAGPAAAMPIAVITGTAGVGKTTLAVRWAHRVRGRFPDGQLYLNLRGFDPHGTSLTTGQVLREFLTALRVPAEQIPAGRDTQIGLFRSLLADKRVLILLDSVQSAEQVRPLLPGSPGCLVVVTSRSSLSSLVAVDGAHAVPVDLLSDAEAGELLGRRLGADWAAADPAAVGEIIERCARLPLALAIASARAATSPARTATTLAAELGRAADGLDFFELEDESGQVRAVFSWSYRALTAPAARLFRLLGLHPGPDVTAAAASAVAGLALPAVRLLLAELTHAHLITEPVPGRYTFHDLLRAYARELVRTHESDLDRAAAQHRMFDHYLRAADTAAQVLEPHREPVALAAPYAEAGLTERGGLTASSAAVVEAGPTEPGAAMRWFTAEHQVLFAVTALAAATGFTTHAWQLAWTQTTFFNRRGRWHDQVAALHGVLPLADRPGRVHLHRLLGLARAHLGRDDDAHRHFRHALDLARALDDPIAQANIHHNLSWLFSRQDRLRATLTHAQQALDLYTAAGHRAGQARMLNAVGWTHALLGDHQQALRECRQALDLLVELADRPGQANTWDSLGYVHHQLGDHRRAITCYQHALALFRTDGDRFHEADTLAHLGDAQLAADVTAARQTWQQALTILEDLGHADAGRLRDRLAHQP